MTARIPLVRAIVLAIALLIYYAALGVASDTGRARNERDTIVPRLGITTVARSDGVASDGTALVLSPQPHSAWTSATWDISSYEVSHLLQRASSCRVELFVADTAVSSDSPRGAAEILLDGAVVRHISFSQAQRGFFRAAPGRDVPNNILPGQIDIAPLDRRYGFVVPLSAKACTKSTFEVTLRARDADWTVSSVGLALHYTPARVPLWHSAPLTILCGALLAAAFVAALFGVLRGLSSLGAIPVVAAVAVLAIAPLTHDQWDFPLWIRFSEMASFGAANPAYLWDASPLWTIVPTLFSTVTLASYLATGDGSRILTELLMRVGMALAYCYTAYIVANVAPRRVRRFYAILSLLIPTGLYEVAGGYREPFAAALALWALSLSRRRVFVPATLALCAAASISETLLPLVLFPAALAFAEPGDLKRRCLHGTGLAALGIGLFSAEWLLLIPRTAAGHALVYRFGEAPLGGASWAGALNGLGLLPHWIPINSVVFGATVFLVAATAPALRLFATFRDSGLASKRRYAGVLGAFTAFVAAFFVAFRGVDPNMWYLLFAVTLYYFAIADPTNPFPLVFGSISGLTFYGVLGAGDFIGHAVLWPFDRGLLGILGTSHNVFALVQTALTVCLIVTLSQPRAALFSKQSSWFFALFVAAVATTAIRFYVSDFILVASVCGIILITLQRAIDARRRHRNSSNIARATSAIILAGSGAFFGTRNAAAGVATSGALLASSAGLGSCDLILALGAGGVLAVQTGFGITSIVGWAMLVAIVLVAIARYGVREATRRYDS